MPAVLLTQLQEQIAQREQELQALREELQNRQNQFTELTRRKEILQSELRQVEQEIATLATIESTEQPAPTTPTVPASPAPATRPEDQPRLDEWIVSLLSESSIPLTGRQLLEEAQRRGYQSKSLDPLKAMENRLQILRSKGVIRHAAGQKGFLLTASNNGAKQKSTTSQPAPKGSEKTPAKPVKPEPAAKKSSGNSGSSAGAATTAKSGQGNEQPSLRELLTDLLKKSRKPLPTRELAVQVRACGYHSDSKDFVKVVSLMLSKMKNVERVPELGYRLKK